MCQASGTFQSFHHFFPIFPLFPFFLLKRIKPEGRTGKIREMSRQQQQQPVAAAIEEDVQAEAEGEEMGGPMPIQRLEAGVY